MPVELLLEEDGLAGVVVLVLVHLVALLQQMFLNLLDLDHLVAFPASGEHRTLFPVVDVQGLLVEARVLSATEVAD